MSSDFFDPNDIPVVRGRRDPELASRLEAETIADDPGEAEQSWMGLMEGDSIIAKVSLSAPTALGEAWFTYGSTTHVMPGESEQDAFERLADVVNTRVIDLASDSIERVNQRAAEQREIERTRRIIPR